MLSCMYTKKYILNFISFPLLHFVCFFLLHLLSRSTAAAMLVWRLVSAKVISVWLFWWLQLSIVCCCLPEIQLFLHCIVRVCIIFPSMGHFSPLPWVPSAYICCHPIQRRAYNLKHFIWTFIISYLCFIYTCSYCNIYFYVNYFLFLLCFFLFIIVIIIISTCKTWYACTSRIHFHFRLTFKK